MSAITYMKVNIEKPVLLSAAGEFVSEVPWTHMSRSMECYELIIGIKETVYIREEDNYFEVGPGDLLLLTPGLTHGGYKPSKPGVKFYWFHFDLRAEASLLTQEELQAEAAHLHASPQWYWSAHHLYIPRNGSIDAIDRAHILIHQILHVANSNYYSAYSVHYLLTSLLMEISEQVISRLHAKGTKSHGVISFNKIVEWTRIHAAEPLTVTAIADKFNYNKDYLTRLFKQHTSMGPLEFIHEVRIGHAKELLYRTSLTIKEIAAEVGFQDDKYFMRLFRKRVHMTPSQFRNAYYKTFMNNV